MRTKKNLAELVSFQNSDGLRLDGILYQNVKNSITVIHIHGSFGNFYHNHFLRLMAKRYSDAGINFLCFNLSAHDGVAEAVRNVNGKEEWEYIGYSLVDFKTCVSDIQGAIEYAKAFSDTIILQGHSLGCDRILHFLTTVENHYDFVLLGPADSYKLHSDWISPETLDQQVSRIKLMNLGEMEWLPINEYGIRHPPNFVYSIPVTRKAFLSIVEGPAFNLINIQKAPKYWIESNAFVYMGGQDSYQTWPISTLQKYFESRIKGITFYSIADGDHNFVGYEEKLVKEIVTWVANRCSE